MTNQRRLTAFISYASPNLAWATWLFAELSALGFKATLDKVAWRGGDELISRINRAFSNLDYFIPLFDREYFAPGRWTVDELQVAETLARNGELKILPFLIGPVRVPPFSSRLLHFILYDKSEAEARQILRAELSKHEGRDLGRSPLPTELSPYPGLIIRSTHLQVTPDTSRLIREAAEDSQRFLQRFGQSTSGENIAAYMDRTVILGRSYNTQPPQAILKEAQSLRRAVLRDMEVTTEPGPLLDLHLIMGKLLGILSYASLDLGDPGASLDHINAAIYCGKRARHDDLEAWGYGTKGMILRFQGDLRRSLAAVDHGLSLKVVGSARARLLAQAALDHSELKNAEGTIDALKEADDIVDAPPSGAGEMSEGIFIFPRAKYHYYAGAGYLGLSPEFAKDAARQSSQAIDRFRYGTLDEQSYSDELVAYIHLATAELRAGNLDAVPSSLAPLLNAETQYRTAWHVHFLDRLVQASALHEKYRGSVVVDELTVSAQEFITGYTKARENVSASEDQT